MVRWPHKGYVEHVYDKSCVDISVAFTWRLQEAHQRAVWWSSQGYTVRAGGPAVKLMPEILEDVADTTWPRLADAVALHNPNAVFTSRGCIRHCEFCAVPIIEGDLQELHPKTWEPRRIVCDNNLLACSQKHFDLVVDRLKPLRNVDFNQGLDARLLTKYHASRLSELKLSKLRLAWDDIGLGNYFMTAYERLRKAGFPKKLFTVYVLIGFRDTPDDALFRLRTIWNMGIMPFPMRYQPLDALEKNTYVGEHWTEKELARYMRYWARLRWHGSVPWYEFDSHIRRPRHETTQDRKWRTPSFC